MKKVVIQIVLIIFVASSCKNKKPAEYVLVADYTPYSGFAQKIDGKVEKMTEYLYWAIKDGDTYRKGDRITNQDRDSIGAYYDFEVTYSESGDMTARLSLDDSGKVTSKVECVKENEDLTLVKITRLDTLRSTEEWKTDANGDVEATRIRAGVDTLMSHFTKTYSIKKDTEVYQNYNYRGMPTTKSIRVLDEYGQWKTVRGYRDDILTGGYDIKFDEKGYQVGSIGYDKDMNISGGWDFINLKYDANGNWIQTVMINKKDLMLFAERSITYFE